MQDRVEPPEPFDAIYNELAEISVKYESPIDENIIELTASPEPEAFAPVLLEPAELDQLYAPVPPTSENTVTFEPSEAEIILSPEVEYIATQLSAKLETLETGAIEPVRSILEELAQIADYINTDSEMPAEETEIIEARLTVLCAELFEHLGIDYDEASLFLFVQSIVKGELVEVQLDTADGSLDEGTHERKPIDKHLLGSLLQMIKDKILPHTTLGKYALQSAAVE